ncbi:MAG: branched-chain amino acid ABC transporter permease [Pseudorhodobacter sp. PARRP1]|nr:MAG: branched-chain amino acid ABC transporter permease [Pseudorhodobacter sp. PARRP1]
MTEFLNLLAQGATIGGLYALFAAGLSIVFGILRLVNLAHGDMIILGAFTGHVVATAMGLGFIPALIIAPLLMGAFGYALQRLLLNRLIGKDILPPLLVTFGLSMMIQNALLLVFTADTQKIALGGIETASVPLLPGVAVGSYALIVLAVAVVVIGGLHLLLMRTALGRTFRATADDAETARQLGVRTPHVFGLATALALAACGIAGVMLAVWTSFTPLAGSTRLLIAFEVIVIGGIGSIWGTLLGGILLGLAQAIGGWINPEWQMLAGHIAFLAVLVLMPGGLFAQGRR